MRLLLVLVSLFGLAACERADTDSAQAGQKHAVNQALRWVYIDNGAVQCERPAKALSETQSALNGRGVKVKQSQCAIITGTAVAALCGLKDLGIHMHQIVESDLKKARSLGFEPIENLSHYGNKSFEVTPCKAES